jgi:glycosyltransferase involved in cell wall biosynthesis
MVCGLIPVVSDAVGCASDLVSGIGEVVRTGDVVGLSEALTKVSEDTIARKARISERLAHFSVAETALGYERASVNATRSAAY